MLGSFGKPSLVIGNDSRALMVKEIGLKSYFVNEVELDLLKENVRLLKEKTGYPEKISAIKLNAYNLYMQELEKIKL